MRNRLPLSDEAILDIRKIEDYFIDSLKSIIWVGFNLPDMAFSLAA